MKLQMFKIRNKIDGKFSKGGMIPSFSRLGKTWSNIGHLKLSIQAAKKIDYQNCEVLLIDEHGVSILYDTMEPLWEEIEVDKQKRQEKTNERMKRYLKEKDLAELVRLRAKYADH